MQLGVVLLICLFLLCVSEAAQAPYRALGIRPYAGAALSLILLLTNAFHVRLFTELFVNPASIVLLFVLWFLARKNPVHIFQGICLAAFAGISMYFLVRMQLLTQEQGLWMGCIATIFALPLYHKPFAAMFCVVLSPLLFSVCMAVEELSVFGYTIVSLGLDIQFDAQIVGLLLTGTIDFLFEKHRERALQ